MPSPQPLTQCSIASSSDGALEKIGNDGLLEGHHVVGQAADVAGLDHLRSVRHRGDGLRLRAQSKLTPIRAAVQALIALPALGGHRHHHAIADRHALHVRANRQHAPHASVPLDGGLVRIVDDDRRLRAKRIGRVLGAEHARAHGVAALRGFGLDHDLTSADRQQREVVHELRGVGAEAGRHHGAELPAREVGAAVARGLSAGLRRERRRADHRRPARGGGRSRVFQKSPAGNGRPGCHLIPP